MRVVIVRHGEPDYVNDCLTEVGREQAKIVAERLLKENIDKIYSSPLGRARETAQPFSDISGMKDIEILDFMEELRYGREEALYQSGHPWNESDAMAAKGIDLRDPNWRDFPVFVDNTAVPDVNRVEKGTDEWLKTLGYEREGLYYRNTREDDSQYTVVLFAHGGSGTAMLSHIYNQSFPYLCHIIHMYYTAITVLRFDRKPGSLAMPIIELMCDDRHLQTGWTTSGGYRET